MLNLNQVRSFLVVLDAGGFRPAARQLGLAASTIVEHIDQLEHDLSSALLIRRRGQVELTTHGAIFEPLARGLVETAQRARDLLTHAPLRVAASTNVGTYLLQQPMAGFTAEARIPIETWIGPNLEVANRLACGRADVALMEWWSDRSGFEPHLWRREPLVVIVSRDHPWASRRSIRIDDVLHERLLGGEPGTGTGQLLSKVLGKQRAAALNVSSGYGSTEAVKRAVRAGHGISLVLASAVSEDVSAGQLVALGIDGIALEKQISIILPAGLPKTANGSRFAAYMLSIES